MVTEEIEYDFENAYRHGIFRFIPTHHVQEASEWYKKRVVDIDIQSVYQDGKSVPYEVSYGGGQVRIKIGDADKTITGSHTYEIIYEVEGALFKTDELLEFYWNVTGNEWPVPIGRVITTIEAPLGAFGQSASCYGGAFGSSERCDVHVSDNTVRFTAETLGAYEGMSIAQSLNRSVIYFNPVEKTQYVWFIVGALILALMWVIVHIYQVFTKHKVAVPVIAQYEPYEGIGPMYAGILIDKMLHPRDITAGIVYLAEQGFLKIKKTTKKFLFFPMDDYEISLVKDPVYIKSIFLKDILSLFFEEGEKMQTVVSLSDLSKSFKRQSKNRKIIQKLEKALTEDMKTDEYLESVMSLFTRRTRKGYEAMNHLKGFQMFLSVTGKDRFDFHNAPEKSPEQFLEYLPYAIAFGVEKKWAKVFSDITIPTPDWYDGDAGTFSGVAFASDMHAFSSALGNSSGASASSGGGSVGGGAGGGGGGSW